jgi:hypothetical protein
MALELSTSRSSAIKVPVFVDFTQNDAVKDTALAVPFFKYCKFCPSKLCLRITIYLKRQEMHQQ